MVGVLASVLHGLLGAVPVQRRRGVVRQPLPVPEEVGRWRCCFELSAAALRVTKGASRWPMKVSGCDPAAQLALERICSR